MEVWWELRRALSRQAPNKCERAHGCCQKGKKAFIFSIFCFERRFYPQISEIIVVQPFKTRAAGLRPRSSSRKGPEHRVFTSHLQRPSFHFLLSVLKDAAKMHLNQTRLEL